jgi:uncharacterized protein (DUF1501 family)
MTTLPLNRRGFLKKVGAASLLSRFGCMNALAQAAQPAQTDYKALVCIFMAGGNDGHNTLIPQTQQALKNYQTARGSLVLPDSNGGLLPITNAADGTLYALHSGLSAIQPLWGQGKLAMLANVGMLVQPIVRAQYLANSVPLPTNLFSHSDQTQQMQSGFPSTTGGSGWGGRAADAVQTLNGTSTFPTNCSIAGPALFCTGSKVQSAALLPGFNLDASGMSLWPAQAGTARVSGLQQIIKLNSGLSLVQAANQARQDAVSLNAMLTGGAATVTTQFPSTDLGMQMQQIASIISLRNSTGMSRQVFFAMLGGFDTHGGQSWQQYDLLQELSGAMAAFYQYTIDAGVANQVTTFTLSDFGRTLQPSGTGTDHGWGNHHFIMGGAVHGGNVFGTFPDLTLGGPDDTADRGVLIPSTSIDQYGATLATWLGVPDPSLVFQNIGNFTTANLGFIG